MPERSVQIIVTATTLGIDGEERRYGISLDGPRAAWSLPELHEMVYEAADAAGLLSERTTAIAVEVRALEGSLPIT